MKRITAFVAAIVLLTAGAWAQDGKGIYNKYSDNENVSAVYISSSMFKLMGNKVPNMELGEGSSMNLGSIIKNLNSMYLLDCEDPDLCKEIKADVNKFINKYDFEMLMEIKDKGEVVRVYTAGNEKTVSQFIMTAAEYEAFTFICLDGTMSRADLEKAIAKATQQME
ncbi:MAG: DUF4252 domain-containing protein [Bacteroidaceae bacterium]|nr:DUF4252 domain-containing protein [Bacteroidaceae bacterium]